VGATPCIEARACHKVRPTQRLGGQAKKRLDDCLRLDLCQNMKMPARRFPPIIPTIDSEINPATAKRGVAMEFGTGLIEKLALFVIGGALVALIIRASARWFMRSLVLFGILTALYLCAQAFGILGR
jgi:hypothetical protein